VTTSSTPGSSHRGRLRGGQGVPAPAIPALDYHPHPLLLRLIPIADDLGRALGPSHEIVLHDLRHPDRSLCHLVGDVTGRSVGAPATDVVLGALEAQGDAAENIYNYRTAIHGRSIRSSVIFVRDGPHIVGAFCLNVDVSVLEKMREELAKLMGVDPDQADRLEVFRNTVEGLVDDLLAETLSDAGLSANTMLPEDRMRVVATLQARGAFQAKGAVERVADALGVSRFTVYGYLRRLRVPVPGLSPDEVPGAPVSRPSRSRETAP
jgi:predicted transcriptional regulator YheO